MQQLYLPQGTATLTFRVWQGNVCIFCGNIARVKVFVVDSVGTWHGPLDDYNPEFQDIASNRTNDLSLYGGQDITLVIRLEKPKGTSPYQDASVFLDDVSIRYSPVTLTTTVTTAITRTTVRTLTTTQTLTQYTYFRGFQC